MTMKLGVPRRADSLGVSESTSVDLSAADSRALHGPFARMLEAAGPEATLAWLAGILALQTPSLRSSNAFLVAFTGRPEAIDWLEAMVAPPVTQGWGEGAALLGTPWPRIADWLATRGPLRLMALDALAAYRAPVPNMSPLAQIAAATLPEAPTLEELRVKLNQVLEADPTPRVRRTVETILTHAIAIVTPRERGVPTHDLPALFISPDSFPGGQAVLDRRNLALTGVRASIQKLLVEARSRKESQ